LEYRFGKLTAATHTPNIVNNNFGSGDGTSIQHSIALNWDAVSLPMFDSAFWVSGNLGLSQSFGSFSSSDGTFSLAYTATLARAMPRVELRMSDLAVAVAPWLDVPLSRSLTESPRGSNILYSNLPYGLLVQFGARKPVVAGLPLAFHIFSEFDLEAYRQPQLTFGDCLSAGVGIQWYLDRPAEMMSEPVTSRPITVTPIPPHVEEKSDGANIRPELHFTVHGMPIARGSSVPIESRDTLIRQWTMLPRFLLLSDNAHSFAAEYVRLTPDKANDFAIDSLTRLSEIEIAKYVLNVLGNRMTKVTDATIALSGPAPAIDSVERYLESTFRIAHRRIKTRPNHSDRIWIEPTPMLAPVATQWIERSYDLSDLGIEHHIDGRPASWQIALQEGSDNSLYSSNIMRDPKIVLHRISSHDSTRVVATLTALDSAGHSVDAQDTLHIVQGAVSHATVQTDRLVFLADVSDHLTIESMKHNIQPIEWKQAIVRSNPEASWLEREVTDVLKNVQLTEGLKLEPSNITGPRVVVVLEK
jgi:hypothetical protein